MPRARAAGQSRRRLDPASTRRRPDRRLGRQRPAVDGRHGVLLGSRGRWTAAGRDVPRRSLSGRLGERPRRSDGRRRTCARGSRLDRGRRGHPARGAADRRQQIDARPSLASEGARTRDDHRSTAPPATTARLDRSRPTAVDTVRTLAMDAVQKTGNGHPGTAMSLAPAAYLLYQRLMRHDPADPNWPGRDRFVLSCGHSSLTLYIQLYLAGYGLELDDLEALRTWGSKTPGHPEVRPHRRRRDHHRPARPGRGQRGRHGDGRPPRARPARPRRRARREPVRPHDLGARLRRRHRGGRHQRGVVAGRPPAARQPRRALRRQPHLDRGRHRRRLQRGRRQAVRGLRLARADRRLDQRQGRSRA